MNPEDFLITSLDLLQQNKREADLRTCISRAYYAIHLLLGNAVRAGLPLSLLQASGLGGKNQMGHEKLISALGASGNPKIKTMGALLHNLRLARIHADYVMSRTVSHASAKSEYENACNLRDDLQQFGLANLGRILKQELEAAFGTSP